MHLNFLIKEIVVRFDGKPVEKSEMSKFTAITTMDKTNPLYNTMEFYLTHELSSPAFNREKGWKEYEYKKLL